MPPRASRSGDAGDVTTWTIRDPARLTAPAQRSSSVGHVVAIGGKQGDRGDASKANRPIDDDAADGLVLSPRPEPIAPERMLGESVVERRGVTAYRIIKPSSGGSSSRPSGQVSLTLERLGVVATRQQDDRIEAIGPRTS